MYVVSIENIIKSNTSCVPLSGLYFKINIEDSYGNFTCRKMTHPKRTFQIYCCFKDKKDYILDLKGDLDCTFNIDDK